MPDFTFEIHQQCKAPIVVTSRNGKYEITAIRSETHQPQCTCPAFKLRKQRPCKHIMEAEEDICDWHSMFSPEVQTEYQKENCICPKCGNKTEYVRVAV